MSVLDKVYFEIKNNKKILCYFSEPINSSKKLIIFNHGFRSSSIGPARTFVDFSRILLNNGFSIFRYDQPNSGNSDGDYLDSSFKEWVETIVYFGKKYLGYGYKVAFLGQSMGACASVVATNHPDLKHKIPCILLWVPGTGTDFVLSADGIKEEEGQKYRNTFWQEAKASNFFHGLDQYSGRIHLVYGDRDRYVPEEKRNEVIKRVKAKNQSVMILAGQNHSPWEYDVAQSVYKEELEFLKKHF